MNLKQIKHDLSKHERPFDPKKIFRPSVSKLNNQTILMFVPSESSSRGKLFVDAMNATGFHGNTVEVKSLNHLENKSVFFGKEYVDLLVFSVPAGYAHPEVLEKTIADFKVAYPVGVVVVYLESREDMKKFAGLEQRDVFVAAAHANCVFDVLSALNAAMRISAAGALQ